METNFNCFSKENEEGSIIIVHDKYRVKKKKCSNSPRIKFQNSNEFNHTRGCYIQ